MKPIAFACCARAARGNAAAAEQCDELPTPHGINFRFNFAAKKGRAPLEFRHSITPQIRRV
jgi:hypothetical protein